MSLLANDLHFSVSGTPLIEGISVHVDSPKLCAIIGPNGAGKSTLLHCLAGLHSHMPVRYFNQHIKDMSDFELAAHRAVLPQSNVLGFPFAVETVVKMSFSLFSLSHEMQNQLAQSSMAAMDVAHLADRDYMTLSGGEQQRVHLARVLAQLACMDAREKMKFLFLDEPTAPLDLKHQFQLFEHLKSLPTQHNTAVFVVVHDLDLAAAYCDEMWLLSEGRLVKTGTPQEVMQASLIQQHFGVNLAINSRNNIPQLDKLSLR